MIKFALKGWEKTFGARKQDDVIDGWKKSVARESLAAFRAGMLGSHSGKIYRRRGGRIHRASVNVSEGEYPANDTGELLESSQARILSKEIVIGTTAAHARFLRTGTRHMERRRMSDNALKEGAEKAKPKSRGWVKFQRAKQGQKIDT